MSYIRTEDFFDFLISFFFFGGGGGMGVHVHPTRPIFWLQFRFCYIKWMLGERRGKYYITRRPL